MEQLNFDFGPEFRDDFEEYILVEPITLTADRVLECAKGRLEEVLIIGFQSDGEHYYATSDENLPRINFMVDRFKEFLMRNMY